MVYRIFSRTTREPVDTVEVHVLAKAYRAAWRSLYATEPVARHALDRLDLVIDFGGSRFPMCAQAGEEPRQTQGTLHETRQEQRNTGG